VTANPPPADPPPAQEPPARPAGAPGGDDSPARAERAALADLLAQVGPQAPTLCEGWTARDLAAHLIVRERRPDAAAGIVVGALKGHGERVRREVAGTDYAHLVDAVRRPAWWSFSAIGPLDRAANTLEYFVHHEDVRRAGADWRPRPLAEPLGRALWSRIPGAARLALRKMPAAITLAAPGYGEARAGAGGPRVTLTGDPGELALFLTGRQRVALVELTGPDEMTDRLRRARLGV
jgi:uncharacterized protein (TIGR03085 family)